MIQHERESAMIRQSTMANEPQRSAGVNAAVTWAKESPAKSHEQPR